jgi:hypothetical protein
MGKQIKILDKDLKCLICDKDDFDEVEVKINTSGGVWFGLEWADATGKAYICTNCGFKHDFYKE